MYAPHLRTLIRHILIEADLYSEDAVELLMLTAAKESDLGFFLTQLGGGPGRGIFQMESETEKSLWQDYLKYRKAKAEIVKRYDTADENDLWWNLGYQIITARLKYLWIPKKLPKHNDIIGMAEYWKKYWNTEKGKGTVEEAVDAYKRHCL